MLKILMTIKWRSLEMLTKMLLSLTQAEQEPAWDLGHLLLKLLLRRLLTKLLTNMTLFLM